MNKRQILKMTDLELLERLEAASADEREFIRAEILRRMGQDWRSRQRAEAGKIGGSRPR